MINVAINGYGRIGRNILRAFYERPDLSDKMQIVAINDLGSPDMNAHLTQFDTTHGHFQQPVSCLLYTSPSPRDVEESRMPSSA